MVNRQKGKEFLSTLKVRAFSMVELLVVIAIIAVTAAILFAVIARVKGFAKTAPCTQNLKSIGLALSLYRSGNDDQYPLQLANLQAFVPQVKSALICPSDSSAGANAQASSELREKVSLFYWRPYPIGYREALQQADPDYGVAFCVLHGTPAHLLNPDPAAIIENTRGLVIRLLADGSVHHAQVGVHCSPPQSGGLFSVSRTEWSLLTDVPCQGSNLQFCDNAPLSCDY